MAENLEPLATLVVDLAKRGGATDSECTVSEGSEFSVNVRLGEVETLTQAGSRGAGVRVLIGQNTGSAYTSDLSRDGLETMVRSALQLAQITTEDTFAGLPDEFGSIGGDLKLYSESIADISAKDKISWAKQAEAAALSADPRIFNSEGGSFENNVGFHVFANSRGFLGSYRTSSCSMSAVPVAREGESMERDYWFTAGRSIEALEKPEEVGRVAASRTLRRLGARTVPTQRVPVVFEPRTARSLLGHLFEGVSGDSIYQNESFLEGKLGERIGPSYMTVVDDGTIPGLFGTSPFDDEGVPTRRTVIVENGVLKNYLMNTYTGRKLSMPTTGNASRGLTGNASVGHNNFYLEAGTETAAQIIGSLKTGFYVTELMGDGANTVTGDYSRGAAGLWIENGEITYAVSKVTIASTLQEMFAGLERIGSDLEFRGSVSSPTLLIGEMTVSGQ